MTVGSEPAFPTHEVWEEEKADVKWIGGGLTKREYFAGLVMQGMMAGLVDELNQVKSIDNWNFEACASTAVLIVDSLIEELAKK